MPRPLGLAVPKPKIWQFSMDTLAAERILTPIKPLPAPLIDRLRSVTTMVPGVAVLASLMTIPLTPPLARSPPKPDPWPPSMVMDVVIVTAPNPAGSSASISPLAAVFEIAPANVLHGAVREHGLTSSPTPDTQVRVACACASEARTRVKSATNIAFIVNRALFIANLLRIEDTFLRSYANPGWMSHGPFQGRFPRHLRPNKF